MQGWEFNEDLNIFLFLRFLLSLGQSGNIVCVKVDCSKQINRRPVTLRDAIGYDLMQSAACSDGNEQGLHHLRSDQNAIII